MDKQTQAEFNVEIICFQQDLNPEHRYLKGTAMFSVENIKGLGSTHYCMYM